MKLPVRMIFTAACAAFGGRQASAYVPSRVLSGSTGRSPKRGAARQVRRTDAAMMSAGPPRPASVRLCAGGEDDDRSSTFAPGLVDDGAARDGLNIARFVDDLERFSLEEGMAAEVDSRPPPSARTSSSTNIVSSAPRRTNKEQIFDATSTLQQYDTSQQQFLKDDGMKGRGGGTSALRHIRSLSSSERRSLQSSVFTLVHRARAERASDPAQGRIVLGFCASDAPEVLAGLKSWVTTLGLPRGLLHGMDVDGVPVPVEELGAVYVKYSSGRARTSRWRPGDAVLETYDGDFRGVYLNVQLSDGDFRQFGVLPTDLFIEDEDDD